jgi:hypothetical protein
MPSLLPADKDAEIQKNLKAYSKRCGAVAFLRLRAVCDGCILRLCASSRPTRFPHHPPPLDPQAIN